MAEKRTVDTTPKQDAKDQSNSKPQTSETVHLSAEELKKVSGGGRVPPPPPVLGHG